MPGEKSGLYWRGASRPGDEERANNLDANLKHTRDGPTVGCSVHSRGVFCIGNQGVRCRGKVKLACSRLTQAFVV